MKDNVTVGFRLGDLSGIPDSIKKHFNLKTRIVCVLGSLNGVGSVNEILIGLYKSFDIIEKRETVLTSLNRLCKGGVVGVRSKNGRIEKGVYELR